MRYVKLFLVIVLAFTFTFTMIGLADAAEKCPLCGMKMAGNENTAYEITTKDFGTATYCCPHCGLWVHATYKDQVTSARARSLLLIKEIQERLEGKGWKVEWADLINDLERVKEVTIMTGNKEVTLRTELKGGAAKAFQAAGVAVPPTVRMKINEEHAVNA